jgi:probable selenium-dependent hydroxylase accessory protein YqeC
MILADALLPLMIPGTPRVVAFVGAGGKTSALFRLARELEGKGRSVLVTTTTRLADPRGTEGDGPGEIVFRPEMEFPLDAASLVSSLPAPETRSDPGPTILLSRVAGEPGKVKGIHPTWIPALKPAWDFVLVEADGSKRLPVKAPARHEPVIPPGTDLVVGVVGLECLGRPMDGGTVHRPELFARVTGCDPGAPIGWEHLVSLARHPEGLFKGVGTPRVVVLNKADRAPFLPSRQQLAELAADLVLLCRLEIPEGVLLAFPEERPA